MRTKVRKHSRKGRKVRKHSRKIKRKSTSSYLSTYNNLRDLGYSQNEALRLLRPEREIYKPQYTEFRKNITYQR